MARTEREWESTKRRLTFCRIFLEILPYKSFTKFGVCSKEDEKKKTIFLAIFCYFSWNKKQIHAQKTFFLESTSCKTTAPHNFNADQLNGSGTYLYHAEWLRQKELSPKSDEDQFSPHNVNTFSKEMVMRFIKWSPQGKYFDLLSNSLN